MTQPPEQPIKIKLSITNIKPKEGEKRPLFDLTIFQYPEDPQLILFRRILGVSMDPFSKFFVGKQLENPLRSHVITFINSLKPPF